MEDDASSVWSEVLHEDDIEALLRQIAQLKLEHTAMRNQMHMMAAFAHQPVGQHVHAKARMLQSVARRQLVQKKYSALRNATVKVQTAYRRFKQQTTWQRMLTTFPERTKAALLLRAVKEKQNAVKEKQNAVKEKQNADALSTRLAAANEANLDALSTRLAAANEENLMLRKFVSSIKAALRKRIYQQVSMTGLVKECIMIFDEENGNERMEEVDM